MLEGMAASPFSAPTATSCSRNSGLPSAVSTISRGPRLDLARPRAPRALARRHPRARPASAAICSGGAPPTRAAISRNSGRAMADDQNRLRRRRTRRGTRAGRAASAPPSGRPRRPRPAAARPRRARTAAAPPRRSRRPAPRPRDEPDRAQDQPDDRFLVPVEQLRDPRPRIARRRVVDDLCQRPVGDALAVRQAAPDRDRGVVELPAQLAHQPRLADPGGPGDRHGVAASVRLAPAPSAARSSLHLVRPAHERAARRRLVGRVVDQPEQPPRAHLGGAALQRDAAPAARRARRPRRADGCSRRAGSRPRVRSPPGARPR